MNEMPMKQRALVATLVVIGLYAVGAALWFTTCQASWKKAAKTFAKSKETYFQEEKLISEKSKWRQAYDDEKALMPVFEVGKATDTTWLQKMDEIASRHHVSISQRKVTAETDAGEVKELVIEVSNWEGALESLVGFLHELENTSDGMFDISSLSFKPAKGGFLKGGFSLTCAYMRE